MALAVEPSTFWEWIFVIFVYAASSGTLWLFPQFIHKKKQVKFSAVHISHRGGSGEGYENTLKAYKRSINAGTDMIELDVRLTKDGKVVVIHDENLLRLTGHPILVRETNYQDFPPLKQSVRIEHFPTAPFEDLTWSAEDRKVPMLIDVFRHFPQIPINIDIKQQNEELVQKVHHLIQNFNRKHITVWGSSNRKTCDLLYKTDPEINIFFCTFKVILVLLLSLVGLLSFFDIRETHFEVFLPLSIKKLLAARRKLTKCQSSLFCLPNIFIRAGPFNLISHLRARGIQVYFWVCNAQDEFEECIKVSSAIMTDFPAKLRQYLDNHEKLSMKSQDKVTLAPLSSKSPLPNPSKEERDD